MKTKRMLWGVPLLLATLPLQATLVQQNTPSTQPQRSNCYSYVDRVVQVRLDVVQDGNKIYLNGTLFRASGSIVGRDSAQYQVLTAFHFIEPLIKNYRITDQGIIPDTSQRDISVSFYDDRPTRSAIIDWYDEMLDIAVLKVPVHEKILPIDPLVYGNSDQARPGDVVFTMGSPLEVERSMLTTHITNEQVDVANFSSKYVGRRIPIQDMSGEGVSGGPVLNERCELIGTILSSRTDPTRGAGFDMMLPINYVARLLHLPKDNGRIMHAYLYLKAISLYKLNEQMQGYFVNNGIRDGVLVVEVTDGSNAQNLGIRQYDIIYKFDNRRVRQISDITDRILFEYKPGDRVTVELYRQDLNGDYVRLKLEGQLTEARKNYYEHYKQ